MCFRIALLSIEYRDVSAYHALGGICVGSEKLGEFMQNVTRLCGLVSFFAFAIMAAYGQTVPGLNSVATRPITVLADPGPVVVPTPLPDPAVPPNLTAAPAGTNLRAWIFDPRNRAVALGSPGAFVSSNGGAFAFRAANADGSLYLTLADGAHVFRCG